MSAAYWKITIGQGTTWRMALRLSTPSDDGSSIPMDLTGYVARMQVRQSLSSVIPLLALDSGSGGGITIEPAEGRLRLFLDDADTAAFTWRYGLYDLEIESPGGETTRLLKGEVEVDGEVTR